MLFREIGAIRVFKLFSVQSVSSGPCNPWLLSVFLLSTISGFSAAQPSVVDPMPAISTALQDNDTQTALTLLTEFERLHPTQFELNNLTYLQAVLLGRSGNSDRARRALEPLIDSDFLLRDYALAQWIEYSEHLPFADRKAHFAEYLNRYKGHPSWFPIAYTYAQLLEAEGDLQQAKVWYDKLWKTRKKPWSRRGELGHALLHLKTNEGSAAVKDLRALLKKGTRDDVALTAVRTLERLKPMERLTETQAATRAKVYLNNRDGVSARAYFDHLIKQFRSGSKKSEYAYWRGRSYVIDGDLESALEAYDSVYDRYSDDSWGLYGKYQAANTALRAEDLGGAVDRYRYLLRKHPDSNYEARAYFNLAEALIWMRDFKAAEQTCLEAVKKTKAKEHRRFYYELARIHLEQKDYPSALKYLERLDNLSSARLPSGVTREEIYYLKGFTLNQLGEAAEAEKAFREGANSSPNYFGFHCREQVRGFSVSLEDSLPGCQRGDKVDACLQRDWMASLLQPRTFHQSETGRVSLDRIQELLYLGMLGEAAQEINRHTSKDLGMEKSARLFNIAYFSLEGGFANQSVRVADRFRQSEFKRGWPESYPVEVRRLLFPLHFWEVVQAQAVEQGVDPRLVLSVIRREGVFDSEVKSAAAARGLMQFMIPTARKLAEELGIPEPKEEDLYRPELSIQLGSYYLKKLLDRFDGSIEKALASYNAGVENVARWESKLGDPQDLPWFVSNIGFRETKLYTLKVLGDYYGYRAAQGLKPIIP
jgi:soluble lytic murein transglycosylase